MNNVTPGKTKTIPIEVEKASNYHVIVYTVTGIDTQGRTIKAVDDGAVEDVNGKSQFNAKLRLK